MLLDLCNNVPLCVYQPLHSDISTAPTLLGLQSSGGGSGSTGEPLMESMGDPVEELREAVEMLNDTVRERGRSQSHDQAVQELLSKVRRRKPVLFNSLVDMHGNSSCGHFPQCFLFSQMLLNVVFVFFYIPQFSQVAAPANKTTSGLPFVCLL